MIAPSPTAATFGKVFKEYLPTAKIPSTAVYDYCHNPASLIWIFNSQPLRGSKPIDKDTTEGLFVT